LKKIPSKPLAYVSSALNAYQAFDILFSLIVCRKAKTIKKRPPAGRSPYQKDMVIPSVPEASHVVYLA